MLEFIKSVSLGTFHIALLLISALFISAVIMVISEKIANKIVKKRLDKLRDFIDTIPEKEKDE